MVWFPYHEEGQDIYGALDLGGASTQITFVPSGYINESTSDILYFLLYGKEYNVYSHSFLCYGKDQALLKKLAKDIKASIIDSRSLFPTSCCFFLSLYFSNLSEVGYCIFQTTLDTISSTSGEPLLIILSRNYLLIVISKNMAFLISVG